jgi:hypothetical protein
MGSINRRIVVEAVPGKNMRPYVKILKKGLEAWLEWLNTCLANGRP